MPILRQAFTLAPQIPRFAPSYRTKFYIIKLGVLFGFCGRPLLIADLLKPRFGDNALIFAIAPLMPMVFGALAIRDEEKDGLGVFQVKAGLVGAGIVAAMHLFAAGYLGTGHPYKDTSFVWFGISVGSIATWGYVRASLAFLRPREEPASRAESPIELPVG